MAGVKRDAFANYGLGVGDYNALNANAQNIYGAMEPQVAAAAAHPQGLTPQQMAAQRTAAQQSAGGGMASATGQGALLAARTRNAGAAQNAIQQAGRQTGQELGNQAVQTEMQNATLQNQNQQRAQAELGKLYNTELGGSQEALGLSNQALDVANKARPGFWQQFAQEAGADVLKGLTTRPGG